MNSPPCNEAVGSATSHQKRTARPKASATAVSVKVILRMRIEASFNGSNTMICDARRFPAPAQRQSTIFRAGAVAGLVELGLKAKGR